MSLLNPVAWGDMSGLSERTNDVDAKINAAYLMAED